MRAFRPCWESSLLAPLLLVLVIQVAPDPVAAQILEVDWQPEATIDTGIDDVSETPGASVAFFAGAWRVVYVKDGNVMLASQNDGVWQTEPLTAFLPPVAARAPGLAVAAGFLHVVWEDDQGLIEQVRTRRSDGTTWSVEECLSCSGTVGRSPAVGGEADRAFAAWVDEPTPGTPVIVGARFEGGSWQTQEPVSLSPAAAEQPAVAVDPVSPAVYVVWSDTRNGNAELYLRMFDSLEQSGWGTEIRLTDMAGNSTRPSIHSEGPLPEDVVNDVVYVTFENDSSGHAETWSLCFGEYTAPQRISPLDPVASERPNLSGFRLQSSECQSLGGDQFMSFVVYSDRNLSSAQHQLAHSAFCPTPGDEIESVLGAVQTSAAVGAVEGDPDAEVTLVYVNGTANLRARVGSLPGTCEDTISSAPAVFLIAPLGVPSNGVTVTNTCWGPKPFASLELTIFPVSELTFDPGAGSFPHYHSTDPNGDAELPVRGGGCDEFATAYVSCPQYQWSGVRSPDIDGDCHVNQADLDYVDSVLGTSDFCGDLDGSGTVDAADRAIVEATLGDLCAHLTDVVSDPWVTGGLTVLPNPTRGQVTVRLKLVTAPTARIRVVDVAGRVKRHLGTVQGPSAVVPWDGRDDTGRELASGLYFVLARTPDRELRRSVLLLR